MDIFLIGNFLIAIFPTDWYFFQRLSCNGILHIAEEERRVARRWQVQTADDGSHMAHWARVGAGGRSRSRQA